ncbi:murein hydrolase activator EnvC family protein [Niameybacter massiliensis]|uniref:murein hydrolase activator EnvC family protein n=1 Tax=Niameybacter massiliensis TaxID=1658108 RepID=UPI0006B46023|nr:M23 family metallopeptidase [Niameybacter massiliensis]
MKRRVLLVWALIISIGIIPLYGSSLSDKKSDLKETQQNIQDSKNQLSQVEKEQTQLEKEVDALDKKIVAAEDKLLKIETDLEAKKSEVEVAKEELEAAIEKKEYQYEATKDRMVQMYKNEKSGYIELIFSSGSLGELLDRTKYIKVISEYDNQLLDEYQKQEEVIAEKKATLEVEQVAIEGLRSNQEAAMSELESMRKDKNKKIAEKKSKARTLSDEIDEMEEISKELEKEIKRLTEASTVKYSGGKFEWPVPGYYRLSSQYNPRNNPISGIAEFHQGIDIPAPYGEKVIAAADGKVIVSGWVRGFGNTIMIDHGSGIVSIYGHNSSLTVSVGEYVSRGTQVARIGSTGNSTGNHCHFEVRVNGRHTSPWNYLNN